MVLRGEGRSFSAGNDLKALGERPPEPHFQAHTLERIERLPQPVIASVRGHCYTGALELLLASDLIVCSENARFCDTHGKWGMSPSIAMKAGAISADQKIDKVSRASIRDAACRVALRAAALPLRAVLEPRSSKDASTIVYPRRRWTGDPDIRYQSQCRASRRPWKWRRTGTGAVNNAPSALDRRDTGLSRRPTDVGRSPAGLDRRPTAPTTSPGGIDSPTSRGSRGLGRSSERGDLNRNGRSLAPTSGERPAPRGNGGGLLGRFFGGHRSQTRLTPLIPPTLPLDDTPLTDRLRGRERFALTQADRSAGQTTGRHRSPPRCCHA